MNSFSISSIKHLLSLWTFIIIVIFIECSNFRTPPVYDESLKSSLSISIGLGDHAKVWFSNSCSIEVFESECGKTRKNDFFFFRLKAVFVRKGALTGPPYKVIPRPRPQLNGVPAQRIVYVIPADFIFWSTVFVSSFT